MSGKLLAGRIGCKLAKQRSGVGVRPTTRSSRRFSSGRSVNLIAATAAANRRTRMCAPSRSLASCLPAVEACTSLPLERRRRCCVRSASNNQSACLQAPNKRSRRRQQLLCCSSSSSHTHTQHKGCWVSLAGWLAGWL